MWGILIYCVSALLALLSAFTLLAHMNEFFGTDSGVANVAEQSLLTLEVYVPPKRLDDLYQAVDISFGNQMLAVQLDTSSADTFFASDRCSTTDEQSGCFGLKHTYAFNATHDSVQFGKFDKITEKGRVRGDILTTKAEINHKTISNLTVGWIHKSPSNGFEQGSFSGSLGLGMLPISQMWQNHSILPFFHTLAVQGIIPRRKFSLSSPRFGDPDQRFGKLTLGGIEERFAHSHIAYSDTLAFSIPANDSARVEARSDPEAYAWSVELQSIRINGNIVPVAPGRLRPDRKHVSVVDSASPYIYIRTEDFYRVINDFEGLVEVEEHESGDHAWFQCDKMQTLEFKVNEQWIILDPLDLVEAGQKRVKYGMNWCRATLRTRDEERLGDGLMGLPFLRSVFTVFEYDEREMYQYSPRLGLLSTVEKAKIADRYHALYKKRI
ncbi:acid protease [Corynespora cassiicola Philippines]|uniref:Acid protease n=1 Tax=Corynespora cassiicola Philippines TaxID=1448308 RepID=A0A2T2N5Y4_CORCC|nr:acid protease [Corynespora cassiicola Philippines]